jgi:HEAT repeat protein
MADLLHQTKVALEAAQSPEDQEQLLASLIDGGDEGRQQLVALLEWPDLSTGMMSLVEELILQREPAVSKALLPLLTSADDVVRFRAVVVLARVAHPAFRTALVGALHDTYAPVRAFAIDGLAEIGGLEVGGPVARLAETDPDPWVRERAKAALVMAT